MKDCKMSKMPAKMKEKSMDKKDMKHMMYPMDMMGMCNMMPMCHMMPMHQMPMDGMMNPMQCMCFVMMPCYMMGMNNPMMGMYPMMSKGMDRDMSTMAMMDPMEDMNTMVMNEDYIDME